MGERTLSLDTPLDDGQLLAVRDHLRAHCRRRDLPTARSCVEAATASSRPELSAAVSAVGEALTDVLTGAGEAKIVVAGAANLARGALDFRDIAPVLDALEEQVVLMRLFSEADPSEELHVSIGAETLTTPWPKRPSSRGPTAPGRTIPEDPPTWESLAPCEWTTRAP